MFFEAAAQSGPKRGDMGGTAGPIYKICARSEWDEALARGRFDGAAVDLTDGFIHFSTGAQAAETAARHFRDRADLVIVAFDAAAFGAALKWEPSRGGALFPHLYGPLDPALTLWSEPLSLDADGIPVMPSRIASC